MAAVTGEILESLSDWVSLIGAVIGGATAAVGAVIAWRSWADDARWKRRIEMRNELRQMLELQKIASDGDKNEILAGKRLKTLSDTADFLDVELVNSAISVTSRRAKKYQMSLAKRKTKLLWGWGSLAAISFLVAALAPFTGLPLWQIIPGVFYFLLLVTASIAALVDGLRRLKALGESSKDLQSGIVKRIANQAPLL